MLEFKTMFISLDIYNIWWHSASVWSFSFCYNQQPSKAEKWELLFSCQLPHWTSALTRLSEKGGFVVVSLQTCILLIQCSIILKRAFQFTYNTHLKEVAQDSTVPTLSYPAPRLRLCTCMAWTALTQVQPRVPCWSTIPAGELRYRKREEAILIRDTFVASSSLSINLSHGGTQAADSNLPFSRGCWEGEGPGSYINQSQYLRKGKKKRCQHAEDLGYKQGKRRKGQKEEWKQLWKRSTATQTPW